MSGQVHDGYPIHVKGHPTRYITDTSAILKYHSEVWSRHWKVGDPQLTSGLQQTIREAYDTWLDTPGAVRKAFTAEGIKTAARNFRRNTSIGTDSWTLTELIKMPEVALTELGKLLSDIQFQAIPPLQAMTNIMATLPKKDGGTRTVAIASTVYRLLMELDNQEVAAFEAAEAFECDSAKAGSSAIVAAEDRALETELAKAEGQHVLVVLWDFTKFFDTINVQVLFEEAAKLGFPLRQLLLSTIVHHSPRRLKLGATIGDAISNLGRSILAGCKRSTHLARVYTLRMVRELSSTHASTRTYQHVDDISNLVLGRSAEQVVQKAVSYAEHFKEWTDKLQMGISGKSTVVPNSTEAKSFARIVNRSGIPMKAAAQGVDIGVDTSAANVRCTRKQRQRVSATVKNARRVSRLARKHRKARRLANTGVNPKQVYGHTAVGMSPSVVNACKSNVALATGLVGPRACATSALRWSFRKGRYTSVTADP